MSLIKKSNRIILVVHSCTLTGAPLLGLNLAKVFNKKGYRVFVICLEKGELYKQFRKYGTPVYAKNKTAADIWIKLLKLTGANSIICNSVISGEIAEIAFSNNLNVVSLVHELPGTIASFNAKDKAKKIYSFSAKVVFPSSFVKDRFEKLLGVRSGKFIVKPQGVYMKIHPGYDETTRQAKKKEMGFSPRDKIVMGAGSGGRIKGIDLFYKIACKARQIDKNINFMWVGGVDKRHQWVERQAKKAGIKVIPPTKQIENYYRIADLFLLSSREDSFPSVVLEAIAYGLPVLAFEDAGGFIDIDKRFIRLSEYLNCDAMSELVVKELSDRGRLAYIREYGRSLTKNNYSFSRYAEWLLGICGDENDNNEQ